MSPKVQIQNIVKLDVTEKISPKTAVLLCADLESLGHGLDLSGVHKWLQETAQAVEVHFAPDLDHRPGELAKAVAVSGATRLVVGVCSDEYEAAEVQLQARKPGLDPLGVEIINLGAYAALIDPRPQATEKAKILLAAAVARAQAFPGSRPENVKPYLPVKVSRRSLFALSLLEYRAVPSIQGERCAARTGCQLCVQACPLEALQGADGQVRLDKSRCEGCGLCLTTCPRKAIEFPGYATAQLAAQIATLLDPAMGTLQPRGILFTCQRSALVLQKTARKRFSVPLSNSHASSSEVTLFPVQVPCLGMVPPIWLLGCLTLGAAAVAVVPCPGRCPFAQKEVIEGRVAYCREILQLLGGSPERIRLIQSTEEGTPRFAFQIDVEPETHDLKDRTWSPFPAQMLLQLAHHYQAPEGLSLAHPHSPFGAIEVTDGCTGCGVCADTCPAGALALERRDDNLSLTFDAALCTACGQCLPSCPEAGNQVLRLRRVTDLDRLSLGRVTLYQDRNRQCEACGAPIASETMLRGIKATWRDGNALALSLITRYCPDCRGRLSWSRCRDEAIMRNRAYTLLNGHR